MDKLTPWSAAPATLRICPERAVTPGGACSGGRERKESESDEVLSDFFARSAVVNANVQERTGWPSAVATPPTWSVYRVAGSSGAFGLTNANFPPSAPTTRA